MLVKFWISEIANIWTVWRVGSDFLVAVICKYGDVVVGGGGVKADYLSRDLGLWVGCPPWGPF